MINQNPSNSFSIGYRIDSHNSPSPGNPCITPPPANENAFPTTDNDGLSSSTLNWLNALDCVVCPGGWSSFSELGICTPSGDWNIRAMYTSLSCEPEFGACCLSDGSCTETTPDDCSSQGGTFQGDGSDCGDVNCPQPVGACCFEDSCSNLSEAQCTQAGGELWGGPDTECDSFDCNPTGACCLSDGTCVDGILADECTAAGGEFQGADVQCDSVSCPQPTGACCLGDGGCFSNLTEVNCESIPDAAWAGAGSTCEDADGNDQADICEQLACPGDLDMSGTVGVKDLLALLGSWGSCGTACPPGCDPDLTEDCEVNVNDLLTLLGNWGPCR